MRAILNARKKLLTVIGGLACACTLHAQAWLYPIDSWFLPPGLNTTLSASVIVSPDAGSGFSNSISIAYADSIMSRLTYAVGGYARYNSWRGRSFSDAGLAAMLNYRFDDHWEATLYAPKNISRPDMPIMSYWMMADLADKIGAEVRYHFSPAFSVGVSVWHVSYPDVRSPFADVRSPFANSHQPPAFYGGR